MSAKALQPSTTLTSPTFSTSSGTNQLLLALVAVDGPNGASQSDTVTGAGLTWSLVTRANPAGTGAVEVWKATPTAALSNVSVSATESISGYSQALTVEAISGTSGVGASNHSSGSTGAPGTSVTTTAANSLLFGVGDDGATAITRTPNSGQAITNQQNDTSNSNTEWTQKVDVPVPASGTPVTVGDAAPTSSGFNMAAVEVKAAAGGSTISQAAGYNALDELTTLNGSSTGLSYDGDGNETANPGSALKPGSAYSAQPGRSSSYNDRDQQSGITPTGSDALTNYFLGEDNTKTTGTYDPITDTGKSDETTMLGLSTEQEPDTTITEFQRTPDGQLTAEHTSAGSSYYLTDNLGSIVGLVDGTGTTRARYTYDPTGNTRAVTGDLSVLTTNPYGCAAGYTNPSTGLTKFGARYYDPNTSRFTQQDPSGQETNPYAYAGDNAVNVTDASGEMNCWAFPGEWSIRIISDKGAGVGVH